MKYGFNPTNGRRRKYAPLRYGRAGGAFPTVREFSGIRMNHLGQLPVVHPLLGPDAFLPESQLLHQGQGAEVGSVDLGPDARQLQLLKAVLEHPQTPCPPEAAPPVPAGADSDSEFCRAARVVDPGKVGVAHQLAIRFDAEPQKIPFWCSKQPFPTGIDGLSGQIGCPARSAAERLVLIPFMEGTEIGWRQGPQHNSHPQRPSRTSSSSSWARASAVGPSGLRSRPMSCASLA